jgi:hypothetical protein
MANKKQGKAAYYALDMPNGITYIGRMNGNNINSTLEDVILTETLTNWSGPMVANGKPRLDDIQAHYAAIYLMCRKHMEAQDLPIDRGYLPYIKMQPDGIQPICKWFLGYDIMD